MVNESRCSFDFAVGHIKPAQRNSIAMGQEQRAHHVEGDPDGGCLPGELFDQCIGGVVAMMSFLGYPPSAGICLNATGGECLDQSLWIAALGSGRLHRGFVALSDFCPLMDFHCSSFGSDFTFVTVILAYVFLCILHKMPWIVTSAF